MALRAPGPSAPRVPSVSTFHPRDVGPVHQTWSAPGDGVWIALVPAGGADERTRMYKTLLHPDDERSWAELFVVAIDLASIELHLLPGTREPQATEPEAATLTRPGFIPAEHQALVLAAFNGGFKTEHGHYGMRVQDITLVVPHAEACAVAYYKDHSLKIASWPELMGEQSDMTWLRETPQCMYEDGKLHWRIAEGFTSRWGATVEGETVIRRSAIGVDAAGKTLFVGISNHTTAPAIALGMHHAGADTVAQLDVNFSYPKFVTFEPSVSRGSDTDPRPVGSAFSREQSRRGPTPNSASAARGAPTPLAERVAVPLADGFELSEDEYIRKPSQRDFFYVMPADPDRRTARK
jgi:hypothetical protein